MSGWWRDPNASWRPIGQYGPYDQLTPTAGVETVSDLQPGKQADVHIEGVLYQPETDQWELGYDAGYDAAKAGRHRWYEPWEADVVPGSMQAQWNEAHEELVKLGRILSWACVNFVRNVWKVMCS